NPERKYKGAREKKEIFMSDVVSEIEEIVNRETRAWDSQDADLLMTVFHPDMVWPWPRTPASHDPTDWVMELGRYDYARWKSGWQELFDTHTLIHNRREIKKIVVSKEGDGAFAVVDIDTLWRDGQGRDNHWKGRVCKVYSKVGEDWKMTMHTGVLDYSSLADESG
ncbi:MAG: nuclear transport factor 2 family protein, partial [Blastocatellia bacterium]|nr:nuclear transport factor 2 family protein [Blastocatellia bacterium]